MRDMQVFPQKMRADTISPIGWLWLRRWLWRWRNSLAKPRRIVISRRCRQALDRHCPLVDLSRLTTGQSYLSRERLTTLLRPATATGSAERFVRQVLARLSEQRDES